MRYVTVLLAGFIFLSCSSGGSDAETPTDPGNDPPPSQPVDANISILTAQAHTTDIGGLTARVQNAGGPGTYKVEVWGIPHSLTGLIRSLAPPNPLRLRPATMRP